MAGLWVNDPDTSEGKFPVVLRRDGTQVDFGHFLISEHDPGFSEAMFSYASAHEVLGSDPQYVADCRGWAAAAARGDVPPPKRTPDPDAPRHRPDHPLVLLMARRGWSLDDLARWVVVQTTTLNLGGLQSWEQVVGRIKAMAASELLSDRTDAAQEE